MEKMNFSQLLKDAVNKPGILSSAYRTFHGYSVANQLTAYNQLTVRGIPLGPIATFKKWQELGRSVKRGEKAIALCMPVTVNKKDEAGEKTGECFTMFAYKNNWFALAQTDGDDFQHEAKTPEWDAEKALASLDITEESFETLNGNCQGYALGRAIAINPLAALPHKTRFHEMAHVVLGHTSEQAFHDDDKTPKSEKEVEAESVAYICCSVLGLPGLAESRGYIQHWLEKQITEKSAQRIFGAADKILKAGAV